MEQKNGWNGSIRLMCWIVGAVVAAILWGYGLYDQSRSYTDMKVDRQTKAIQELTIEVRVMGRDLDYIREKLGGEKE